MDQTMQTLLAWFTGVGALSGYAALAWSIRRELADRASVRQSKVSLTLAREDEDTATLLVRFNEAAQHTAFDAVLSIQRPAEARLSEFQRERRSSGFTSYEAMVPTGVATRRQKIPLPASLYASEDTFIGKTMIIGVAAPCSEVVLRVEILDRSSGRLMVRRTFSAVIDHR